eukprot:GHRQ01030269.1.p3 GENE.GHRQ01030269.1~~GHRQ01030269.1.p3  ORF type:complete len:121 (-),score=31.35 GHRQ01030269.1:282-644(-)
MTAAAAAAAAVAAAAAAAAAAASLPTCKRAVVCRCVIAHIGSCRATVLTPTYDHAIVCQLLRCLLLQVPQQALRGLLDGDGVHAVEPRAHFGPQPCSACKHGIRHPILFYPAVVAASGSI